MKLLISIGVRMFEQKTTYMRLASTWGAAFLLICSVALTGCNEPTKSSSETPDNSSSPAVEDVTTDNSDGARPARPKRNKIKSLRDGEEIGDDGPSRGIQGE